MGNTLVVTKTLFLRVPAELHEAVLQQAIAEDRTINKQAIRLLKKALQID